MKAAKIIAISTMIHETRFCFFICSSISLSVSQSKTTKRLVNRPIKHIRKGGQAYHERDLFPKRRVFFYLKIQTNT